MCQMTPYRPSKIINFHDSVDNCFVLKMCNLSEIIVIWRMAWTLMMIFLNKKRGLEA